MSMLRYMSFGEVPSFVRVMYKETADALQWDMWLHMTDGSVSFHDFKEQQATDSRAHTAAAVPKAERDRQEADAIDFAADYIQFN